MQRKEKGVELQDLRVSSGGTGGTTGIEPFDGIEDPKNTTVDKEKNKGIFSGIGGWFSKTFTADNASWAAGKVNDLAEDSGAKWAAGKTTKRLSEFILGRGTVENLRTPGKRLKGTMQAIGMGGLFIASVVCFFALGPIGPLVGGLLGVAHLGAKQTNSIGKRAHEKGEDKLRSLLKGDMDPKTLEQLNAKEKDRAESKEKRNESLSSGVKWGIGAAILAVPLIMFAPMLVPALGGVLAAVVCALPLVAAGVSAYKFNDAYKHHNESKNLKSSINQLYNSQLDKVLQDPAKTQSMCNEIGTEKLDALLKKTGKRIEKGKEVNSLNAKLVQSVSEMEVGKLTCLNESTKKIIGQIKSGTLSEKEITSSQTKLQSPTTHSIP
jgi:hypothetical protein